MIRAALIAAASLVLAAPAVAAGGVEPVAIQFQDFSPGVLDVLPGETVQWTNVSERRHTVTADDGTFDSGDVLSGDTFVRSFDSEGTFAYHCTVHAGMVGEIDVRPVILGPLPTAAVPVGDPVEFSGRTLDPSQPVEIQRADGRMFRTVATATPSDEGTWATKVPATATADYRAAVGAGTSETRHLLVSDRKLSVRRTRRGIAVTVTPALPYGRVVLEENLRERFGWWPAVHAQLDYLSQASFKIARGLRVRVVLVDKDGWTPLATSVTVHVS